MDDKVPWMDARFDPTGMWRRVRFLPSRRFVVKKILTDSENRTNSSHFTALFLVETRLAADQFAPGLFNPFTLHTQRESFVLVSLSRTATKPVPYVNTTRMHDYALKNESIETIHWFTDIHEYM